MHRRWFEKFLPKEGVNYKNRSDDLHGIAISGPNSRKLLSRISRDDVSTKALKFRDTRETFIGGVPAILNRISFSGELGYEIYVAPQFQLKLFEEIEANGKDLGLKLYGSRALMSLRLEKNWGVWTMDFRPDFTAVESGLDTFINWDKNFIGKESTLIEKKQGPKKKLVTMTVETENIDVTNDEAILKDKKCVGYITSGGYAHHIKKSMALGYVPIELSKHNTTLDVEINGKIYLAHVTDRPLYDANGDLNRDGLMTTKEDHGEEIPLNHDEVYFKGVEVQLQQERPMVKGSNWDEDTSSGDYPNNYHFYLPRMCNHCTKPSCLEACPVRAIYKREVDGVVLIDQDKCQGIRECNKACPYDKIYFNYVTGKSQKCIFCFPRLEEGVAPACARQCPGRLRFVGFLEDENGPIHELVYQWKVALPLHPEYGTEPNVFYVPPMLPPTFDDSGEFSDEPRVPTEYLRSLFGEEVDEALITLQFEMERKQEGKESRLMDILIAKEWKSLFNIPNVKIY